MASVLLRVALTALFILGCATWSPPSTGTSTLLQGGRLVVGLSIDPGHLNPAITTAGAVHTASGLLYNGLVGLGPNLEPVPELAESWEVEDDGRLYRFKLRNDVRWHDGTPFTSEDVKYTFEGQLLQFHARTRASVGAALEAINAPDERTVEFRFRKPYATLLLQLDAAEAPIVPQHIYGSSDPLEHAANVQPIGTGPFTFVSYAAGSEIRFARNQDYFRSSLPYFDEVVQRVIPEGGTQVIALEKGEVDWLWAVPGADLARLDEDAAVELRRSNRTPAGSNCMTVLSFNLERPLLADVRLRRAIAHAIDRESFLEHALFGQGQLPKAPIASGLAWASAADIRLPEFDVVLAGQLLDEAGWSREGDNVRENSHHADAEERTLLSLDLPFVDGLLPRHDELLRSQLRAVGIEVNVEKMDLPVYVDTVFVQRDFDLALIGYCQGNDPEIGWRRMYDSRQIGPIPASNASAYRNHDVDMLFEQAAQTIDDEERTSHYKRIQKLVVSELPYVWIVEVEFTQAHRSICTGFTSTPQYAEAAACTQ